MTKTKKCTCDNEQYALGLCRHCYMQKYYKNHKEQMNESTYRWRLNNKSFKGWNNNYTKKYYHNHPTYRIKCNERNRRYYQDNKEHFIDWKRKWRKTEKGKEIDLNSIYKRKGKNWIQILPNIFPKEIPIDYHHVDGCCFVVPIPRKLHECSNGKGKQHLEQANDWVEFYYNLHPMEFLSELDA